MQTVDEIIDRFGRQRLRKLLGVTNSSLSDAIAAGTFPARYYKPMKDEAEAEGWEVPIDLFNWRQTPANVVVRDGRYIAPEKDLGPVKPTDPSAVKVGA